MGRQQSLFQFEGNPIDITTIKLKIKGLPGMPLALGEIVALAIEGTCIQVRHYHDEDSQLVREMTVEGNPETGKIITIDTFENVAAILPAGLGDVLRAAAGEINDGALDMDDTKVTASVS